MTSIPDMISIDGKEYPLTILAHPKIICYPYIVIDGNRLFLNDQT